MNKGFPIVHFYLAVALANLGRRGEAQTAVKAGGALDPSSRFRAGGRPPRAIREHREAARPIIASHGGRIVEIVGDGLLLEFPPSSAPSKGRLRSRN
jgi:hypothetical protein